jgi:glycosyltransferase involved in cell wall biosynthesis
MLICRPFFRRRIYHWHSSGLAGWLNSTAKPWERWLTSKLVGGPDLSIALGSSCVEDAVALGSRRVVIVPNGIPDPCPDFIQKVLPVRQSRAVTRRRLETLTRKGGSGPGEESRHPDHYEILFLSLCAREKGLFDATEAIALINRRLADRRAPLRARLHVAGKFWLDAERREFDERIRCDDLLTNLADRSAATGSKSPVIESLVRYHGFVAGEEKKRLFLECDCFCLPTYYSAESFPVVLLEAMAYGMDIVTTNWRNIPELLTPNYSGIVKPRTPEQIVAALEGFVAEYRGEELRQRFEEEFTEAKWMFNMKKAITDMDLHAACVTESLAT